MYVCIYNITHIYIYINTQTSAYGKPTTNGTVDHRHVTVVYRFLRVYPVWELLQINRNCPVPVSTHSIVTLDHPMIICEALASGIPLLGAPFEQRPPSKKGVLCRQPHNRSEDDIVCPVSARCFNVFNCLPLP